MIALYIRQNTLTLCRIPKIVQRNTHIKCNNSVHVGVDDE